MAEAITREILGCRRAFSRLLVAVLLALPGAVQAVVGVPSRLIED